MAEPVAMQESASNQPTAAQSLQPQALPGVFDEAANPLASPDDVEAGGAANPVAYAGFEDLANDDV